MVSTEASYTFNVTANRVLVANFEIQTYAITVNIDPANGGTVTGANTYNYGEMVTLTVTPAENYVFANWTENGAVISENATYTFQALCDRTLVAHLEYSDGVSENGSNMVVLYPNPVSDMLTVEATEAIDNIEIFNITGAKVFSQTGCDSMVEINTANLPAGTYIIRMMTQSAVEVRRFVKK